MFPALLNEVLSLNAQEYTLADMLDGLVSILNEVLSLNAQEYFLSTVLNLRNFSSMKS